MMVDYLNILHRHLTGALLEALADTIGQVKWSVSTEQSLVSIADSAYAA